MKEAILIGIGIIYGLTLFVGLPFHAFRYTVKELKELSESLEQEDLENEEII